MKKISIILFLLMSTFYHAQSQTAIFDQMMVWYNNTAVFKSGDNSKGYRFCMSNNTIRTDGSGKEVYQYVSYAEGAFERWIRGSTATFLSIQNIGQLFSDRNRFKGDVDALDLKIYKSGTLVKVDIKSRTWGGTTTFNASIAKTAHGGYVLSGSTSNSDFYTLLLSPYSMITPE
jgi:hypothetical protein